MRPRPLFRLAGREPAAAHDVDAEIAFHLAEMVEHLRAQGWSEADAREEARRRFGDVDGTRKGLRHMDEGTRRQWRWRERLQEAGSDLGYALRGIGRAPGYAAVVIATLGLAIGANASMFGVVDRLLLRPPPEIPLADDVRRITVARWIENSLSPPWDAVSFPAFLDLRDNTQSFAAVAAINGGQTMSYGLGPEARPIRTMFATGQYFPLLGTQPVLGRFFGEAEDQPPAGTPVAVLSYAFWQASFGGRRDVVGDVIRLNGHPFDVIGVAPRGFTGTNLQPVDVWVPWHSVANYVYGADLEWRSHRGWQFINVFVRLKPAVPEAAAAEDATRAYQLGHDSTRVYEWKAVPYLGSLVAARTPGVTEGADAQVAAWLLGVAGIVLLIACANVANLVLARGYRRRVEIAVRLALGVSRGRLVRMLLVESVLLAACGAGIGLLLARWGGSIMRATLLPGIAWEGAVLDGRVLLVTTAATIFTAIVAGLLPLLRASRTNLAATLHGATRLVGGAPLRLRAGLLLVQTTLCTALLVGAGLFLRSLERAGGLDLGIRIDRALLASTDLGAVGIPREEEFAFYRQALERLRAIPGVSAAGTITGAPFMGNWVEGIRVPGVDSTPRMRDGGPYYFRVSPGTLEALGARLVGGRFFNETDRAGSPAVAIVTQRMAQALWPGQDPLGKCFHAPRNSPDCREVVGVVANINRQELVEDAFMLYFTVIDQYADGSPPSHIVVSVRGGPPDRLVEPVRRELQAMRADMPYVRVRAYEEVVAPHKRAWRLGATMFSVFALVSLVIAAVGLYGVLSYLVTQRTAELGIRAALGATPGRLLQLVLRSGIASAALGAALGLMLVVLAGRKLQALLFQTSAREPDVLAAAGVVVVGVALVASLVPALRATRVDPMQALRAE